MRTLKRGLKGEDVRQLQAALNKAITAGLVEDGIFGAKTQAAVKECQRANGWKVDGIAGRETLGGLSLIDNKDFEIKTDDLKQFAAPHGSKTYGPNSSYSTYASGGCGVTSFAIVHRAYGLAPAGESGSDTILRLGTYSYKNGYRPKNEGTNAGLFGTNGCRYQSITRSASAIEDALRSGCLVILHLDKGYANGYTGNGHYIVAYGIKNGYVLLRDVGSSKESRQKVALSKCGAKLKHAYKMSKKV